MAVRIIRLQARAARAATLLCNYIANQQCDDAFEDFLAQQADEENAESTES